MRVSSRERVDSQASQCRATIHACWGDLIAAELTRLVNVKILVQAALRSSRRRRWRHGG